MDSLHFSDFVRFGTLVFLRQFFSIYLLCPNFKHETILLLLHRQAALSFPILSGEESPGNAGRRVS